MFVKRYFIPPHAITDANAMMNNRELLGKIVDFRENS